MSLENIEEVEQETVDEETQSDTESVNDADTPSEPTAEESTEEQDTFPREYVEKLRDENAKYRQRAQKADDLARRLHSALVTASGRLQDASDLPYDESHLDDPEALETAISELLAKKPHLASRKPAGNIGQGASNTTDTIDLAAMLRSRA